MKFLIAHSCDPDKPPSEALTTNWNNGINLGAQYLHVNQSFQG